MEEVVCKIDGLVFSNKNTGFFILKATDLNNKKISIKGTFPEAKINIGLKARFVGEYEVHPTHGKQLLASSCEIIPEKGRNGVVTYLTNNVSSIGPITAAKLYNVFGDDLLEILNNDIEKILSVDFLTGKQATAIIEEWKQASSNRTVAIFLADLGLHANQIKSVYSKFGVKSVELIKDNPYLLAECYGIGFITADLIAQKLGFAIDDIRRIDNLILYIIQELSTAEGHLYVTTNQIHTFYTRICRKNRLKSFAHGDYISDFLYYRSLENLKKFNKVIIHNDRIYLTNNWFFESNSANCVIEFIKQEPKPLGNLEELLIEFESKKKITLSDAQKQAFFLLKKSRFCVISGYPGTGKTLLISAFVHLFEKNNLIYSLMSPTGIAAKRLSQVTGKPAMTIHRALGYSPENGWTYSHTNQYIMDAIIVDETSMLDQEVFYRLISSLRPHTILILVGDSNQLPSVGAGYVLNNLMNCSIVPHITLTKIYRQAYQSDIIKNAHAMLNNESIDLSMNPKSEFVFISLPNHQITDELKKITLTMKERESNFQVIAPMYDGELGVDNLNLELRKILNSEFNSEQVTKLKHGSSGLYEGDRILVTKNDYQRMIFNGDTGKVQKISIKDNEVQVKIFDWCDQAATIPTYSDKIFSFSLEEARYLLRVAFASTVHRMQGQEYDYIIIPITMQYSIMLYKNLIYTAITRAKKKVFLFGDPLAFQFAVSNNKETTRNSYLSEQIIEYSTREHEESNHP